MVEVQPKRVRCPDRVQSGRTSSLEITPASLVAFRASNPLAFQYGLQRGNIGAYRYPNSSDGTEANHQNNYQDQRDQQDEFLDIRYCSRTKEGSEQR